MLCSAHGREFFHLFPELSNSGCLPGRAGGTPYGSSGDNYEDRIKSLKEKHPEVEQTYFDTLLTIQKVTSSKVHENAYDGWESNHLRVLLASLRKVLHEMYVAPALRADGRREIEDLKKELLGDSASTSV